MSKILKIRARQVFDSRGNPTVEAEVYSKNLSMSAICPSGASTGTHEAYEKRDKNNKRYLGTQSYIIENPAESHTEDLLKVIRRMLPIEDYEKESNNLILDVICRYLYSNKYPTFNTKVMYKFLLVFYCNNQQLNQIIEEPLLK